MARNVQGVPSQSAEKKFFSLVFSITSKTPWSVAAFPSVTVESRRELRTGSVLDGELPAGNHRQFRCYCPLEPLRKACILTALTEGQRSRVTVSGNRFLAEFRRVTEYRMTPTDRNTPFGPCNQGAGRWRYALACRFSVILGTVPAEV